MKKMAFSLLLIIVIGIFTIRCSKPTPAALDLQKEAAPVVKAFTKIKNAADNYDEFVKEKRKWESAKLNSEKADNLRIKLVRYLDMRIGVINGASKMAANKVENEFEEMVATVEKENKINF